MQYLETDYALFKRLSGYPLDNKGRPLLDPATGIPVNREIIGPPYLNDTNTPPLRPSYGIRVPLTKGPFKEQRGLKTSDPDALRIFTDGYEPNTFKQVPVFDRNITRHNYESIWPCVTFGWTGVQLGVEYIYHDPFMYPDTTSAPISIHNSAGTVIQSGYSVNQVRSHPEPWHAMYRIEARSKDPMEFALICSQIQYLFPGKGAITVTWQSGEQHTCDMLFQREEQGLDFFSSSQSSREREMATQGGDEQRGMSRAYIYLIESYADNTTNQFGVSDIVPHYAIYQRLIELDDLMGNVLAREHDVNLDELQPIS